MWDSHNTRFFGREEALSFVGREVQLNSGDKVRVQDIVCEGPGQYSLLVLHRDYFPIIHKACNNGLYVVA